MNKFRIAETEEDYKAIHDMMDSQGLEEQDITFPVVMAIDDNGLIGFVGTRPRSDMVLAGPLLMRGDKSRPWTFMQLIGMYEEALRNIGITSFIFGLDNSNEVFGRGIRRFMPELKPYATDGDMEFYIRRIDDGIESQRSGAVS